MFENFSKIQYSLNGQTLEFTDIFTSIEINKNSLANVEVLQNLQDLRPDQLSNTIYNDPNLFWSIFLLNDIRNPFTNWKQSIESQIDQYDQVYDSAVFQFGNTSNYLPSLSAYYESNILDEYQGVTFSDIQVNDIIVFEKGDGAFKLKVFGAGQVESTSTCGYPNYGQSLIPDNFLNKNKTIDTSAGGNFTACLDDIGRIWGWGENIGLVEDGFQLTSRLYKSPLAGYTLINVTKNKLIASTTISDSKNWYCYGDGCTTGLGYPVTESKTISQFEFTKGLTFSGMLLFSDNTIKTYGGLTSTESFSTITDISCAENYCLGIIGDVGVKQGKVTEFTYSGISAGLIPSLSTKITKVACGIDHAMLLDETGNIYFVGSTANDRTAIPSGTYIDISAGKFHSAAVNSNNELQVAGQILKESGGCSGATAYVSLVSPFGSFGSIQSGENHLLGLETGTNVKYNGRIVRVDNVFKRIYAKGISAENIPASTNDPAGTVVSIVNSDGLGIKKTIQHQLLSVDSYKNTPLYVIDSDSQVIDFAKDNGAAWISNYIINYSDAANNDYFITPNKLNQETIVSTVQYLTGTKIGDFNTLIKTSLKTDNKIKIKLSDI